MSRKARGILKWHSCNNVLLICTLIISAYNCLCQPSLSPYVSQLHFGKLEQDGIVVGMKQDAAGSTKVALCTRASNLQVLDGPELSEPIECDSIKEWAKADKLSCRSVRQDIPREIARGGKKEGGGKMLTSDHVRTQKCNQTNTFAGTKIHT